ncbi:MAG: hypothetical protein J6X28_03520 [Bacilli bacterium]|nr:hypothetical protein [Bacilli bacterium]
MKFIRKHKTLSIVLLSVLIVFVIIATVFGRYIRNIIHNYILETKNFYFNSSILHINGKNYSITNWDGVNAYTLTIDLNNRKTDEIYTTSDINYTIQVSCPSTVICTLSKNSGTLHPQDSTDSYQITVNPIQSFGENDNVTLTTTVESSTPYHKTMSATYTIGVERSNFSYEIVDGVNEKYLTLNLTNAVTFYQVSEAFGDYAVDDYVSVDDYTLLSPTDQAKCYSAIVSLRYDPEVLFVDMSNKYYINRLPTNYYEETVGGYQWVSGFSFKMNASSSSAINFYKDDITENFTYPIVNSTPVIQVSVQLAN